MLDNLRRKSLSHSYNNLKYQIHFEQGHVICKNLFSIGTHRTRYSKVEALKSFSSTFDSVGKGFWIVFEMLGRVEFNMILCLSGTFIMGRDDRQNNQPRSETIYKPFLLGETEVTQKLYQAVMGSNPSDYKENSQRPVGNVSWEDAILFCNELSRLKGLDECYKIYAIGDGYVDEDEEEGEDGGEDGSCNFEVTCDFRKNGYRLPTEKEWEYAAKAGTQNQYAGTNKDDNLEDYAVYKVFNACLVKSKKPNEWGFYDMSGNMDEWCWDKYDPNDPEPSAKRVFRGGSFWSTDASDLRSADRYDYWPGDRDRTLGFRICRSIVN